MPAGPVSLCKNQSTGFASTQGVPAFRGPARTPFRRGRRRTMERMDARNEIREFLTTRRARLTPPPGRAFPTVVAAGACPGYAAEKSLFWPG